MRRLIKLTDIDGTGFRMNPDVIVYVRKVQGGTKVDVTTGGYVLVREEPIDIDDAIKAAGG